MRAHFNTKAAILLETPAIVAKMKKIKTLILLANPNNTLPLQLAQEEALIRAASARFKHKGKIKLTFMEAATVHDLRQALLEDDFQIVHFSGHGTESGLILEDEFGEPYRVPQAALASLLKEHQSIECVILNACYSISQAELISCEGAHIIAMEERLDDKAALEFSRAFYDAVAAGKSYDFAYRQGVTNVGLMNLDALFPAVFLSPDRSSRDAILINKAAGKESALSSSSNSTALSGGSLAETFTSNISEGDSQTKDLSVKIGVPPLPDIFLGRDEDLGILKERLGVVKGGKQSGATQIITAFRETRSRRSSITALRGFPGIGKTAITTVLAEDAEITTAFPDGVLWTSLGQNPNLIYLMAKWGSDLGSEDIFRAPTLKRAAEILSELLKKKRFLIIIDDVWEAEHAAVFRQSKGNDCSLLIATRAPEVISRLSVSSGAIHNLRGLTEGDSLDLLGILAPDAVSAHRKECLEVVRAVEGLPLALQVAGRLLNEEFRMGWGVEDLLKALLEGKLLIESKAPADLIDLEKQTIPTVAALLRKSVDTLDAQAKECFAYLEPFGQKPATFRLEDLKASWQMDDPKPIIRQLVGRGLLEPVAGNRYQMHSLLITLAGETSEKL